MKNTRQNRLALRRTAAFLILLAFAAFGLLRYAGETEAQTDSPNGSAVFAQFDEWLAHYSSGGFAARDEFVRTGIGLAERRLESFKLLIRTNPRAAIERAIPAETQKHLPEPVARILEKNVSADGDFNVLVFDDLEPDSENYEIEREVVIGASRYKAYVYGRRAAMPTKLGIPLRGVVLDDLMAVEESAVRKIETAQLNNEAITAEVGGALRTFAGEKEYEEFVRDLEAWESKPAPTRELSPWTEGVKKLLFIRVDFPDREGVPVDRFGQVLTESFAQSLLDGPVNTFYFNNSYKKTSLRTTVTPVVRMPQPQSVYTRDNLGLLVFEARNAARAAGFETNEYELDMVAFSQSGLLNFSGISPLANKGALINGNFTFKVVTHELGHAYGLLHANLWRTDDGTVTGSGANVEYGDDFDMMGRGNTQATHFNANYKRSLDWLTENNIQTVTEPGVYRVFAHDTNAPQPAGVRALRIKKDSAKNYWVEFRQLMTDLPNLMDGALVRWDYPLDISRQTQMLDMNPQTQTLEDSALVIGQTFHDEPSGIKITVLGKGNTTPESLDIKVDFNFSVVKGAPFDFDGDNKSDVGVFRPSNAVWYLNNSSQGFGAVQFGFPTDRIVPAKFDADRKTDLAVYRNGTWYVQSSQSGTFAVQFGLAEDIPAPADFDGDGFAEMAVYRPSSGTWYFWNWVQGSFSAVQFGLNGDLPAPADYDGDGKADIGVFRPSNGVWYIQQSANGFAAAQFGLSADKPVQGDFDGDGRADIALYRPSTGVWYLLQSTAGFGAASWGISTDIPAPADYDGDGRTDLTVYRPSEGIWYLLKSLNGAFTPVRFGLDGDAPVAKGIN